MSRASSIPTGLAPECFNDGLRILQHGDTIKINALCEVAREMER